MTKPAHKILLVEDNPGDVLLIQESLCAADLAYDLTHCETVRAAVQRVSAYTMNDPEIPELLLLDYNLPGGDAREVLRASIMNPALSGTRKAVISSSLCPRDREDSLRSGAERFIYKPADFGLFLKDVGGALLELLSKP